VGGVEVEVEVEVEAHPFLTKTLDAGKWLASHPDNSTPGIC